MLDLDAAPSALPYVAVTRRGEAIRGVVADLVPLPVEHLLRDVVMCYDAYPDWYPYQTRAEYRERGERRGRIYGEVQLPWPLGRRDYELDVEQWRDPSREKRTWFVAFTHRPQTGNISALEGRWTLQEEDATHTLVVQDATVDFNTFVPSLLLKVATQRYLPSILEAMGTRRMACHQTTARSMHTGTTTP